MTPEELSDRLWAFAARIGKVVDALPDTRLGRHVAGQLVRCGTAAAPNYDEGRVAESRADFVHKINIGLKEQMETRGWLKLIITAQMLPQRRIQVLFDECKELSRILAKSVLTARTNGEKSAEVHRPGRSDGEREEISERITPASHEPVHRPSGSRDTKIENRQLRIAGNRTARYGMLGTP